MQDYLQIASICLIVISAVFNIIGIYTLTKISRVETNQIIILKSLSVADVFLSFGWYNWEPDNAFQTTEPKIAWRIFWSVRTGIYLAWYATMYMLMLDRFIGSNFPFRHRVLLSKRNIRTGVVVAWVFGLSNSAGYSLAAVKRIHDVYAKFIWGALDGVYVLFFMVTYSSIFFIALRKRRNPEPDQELKFMRVTTVIFVSFMIFEVIPNLARVVLMQLDIVSEISQRIISFSFALNLLADPLIYIFLQPRARKLLKKQLCHCFKRSNRLYTFGNSVLIRSEASGSGFYQPQCESIH